MNRTNPTNREGFLKKRKKSGRIDLTIMVIFLIAAAIPFVPILRGLLANPGAAYYNVYPDLSNQSDGALVITPNHDETGVYLPFVNSINRLQFGDPLIKEYAGGYLNIGTASPMIPFVVLSDIFGMTAGTLIGIFICLFIILVLIYLLVIHMHTHTQVKKATLLMNKKNVVLITLFLYFSISLFEIQNIVLNLKSRNIIGFFLGVGSDGNLLRFPSNSFTFMYFLLSWYLLLLLFEKGNLLSRSSSSTSWASWKSLKPKSLKPWKQYLMILAIGLNGIFYIYNALILGAICGFILILALIQKDKESMKKCALICVVLTATLAMVYLTRQSVNPDALLGMQKYGITLGRFWSREGLAAIACFLLASVMYALHHHRNRNNHQREGRQCAYPYTDVATMAYLATFSLAVLANMSLILGVNVQHFHFLYYESFFLPLLFCAAVFTSPAHGKAGGMRKDRAGRPLEKIAMILIILMLCCIAAVNISSSKSFSSIDPAKQELFSFINGQKNGQKIHEKTIVALDKEDYYLIPIYTDNYVILGNAFSTRLNSTENIMRLAMLNYLFGSQSDGTIVFGRCDTGTCSNFDFFHWAYLYTAYSPPCEGCTYDGKTLELDITTSLFFQIPDQHEAIYDRILHSNFTIQDYSLGGGISGGTSHGISIDYVIVNNAKNQTIRWPEHFRTVYKNEKYELLEKKA